MSNSADGLEERGTSRVRIEDLGGIDEYSADVPPGVTVLAGRNATNRTSFLRALGGVLGGTSATLKRDADAGRVTFSLDDAEYARTYRRTESGVEVGGTPYCDDEALVDHFVTLLEDNPARRAIRRDGDLHEVLTSPLDTEAIQQRIDELQSRRAEVEAELEQARTRRGELSTLEAERDRLEDERDELDETLATLRGEAAEFESEAEQLAEIEPLMERLDERRHELHEAQNRIDVVEAEIEALEDDREQLLEDREQLPDASEEDLEAKERDLEAARQQKRELDDTVVSLTTIAGFNEDVLDGDERLPPALERTSGDVTDGLAPQGEQQVTCWTCGSDVTRREVTDRIGDLRAVVAEKRSESAEYDARIDELQSDLRAMRESLERKRTLDSDLREVDEKIRTREQNLAERRSEVSQLRETVRELEESVADADELDDADLIDTHERISELEYERGQIQQQIADLTDEIEQIEALPTIDELKRKRDELDSKVDDERGRIDELERDVVEEFNDRMDDVLDILDYENVTRVWLDRKKEGERGADPEITLDLQIVRETDTGAYRDELGHMSESERELVGLIVALAGYLVYEVAETVPFVLLDSLEAIDADRIADLVAYFAEEVPYLVVALLLGDASALDETYNYVESGSQT